MPAAPRPSRLLRLAPFIAALALAFLTTSARQWDQLATNLPSRFKGAITVPQSYGAYRFSPAGNEWRLRTWSSFGADEIELRRTYTVNDTIDPIADAHATFPETRIDKSLFIAPPSGKAGLTWSAHRWGWPMRHTQSDQRGYRTHLPLGFTIDSLIYAPVWLAIIYLIRFPVAAISNHFRIPAWACRGCRYDLRGLPDDAPCPECGRERLT